MCKEGSIESFTDENGPTRYKSTTMMDLISDTASHFGKVDGFTLAIFNFKKDDIKERYRVREILSSFGFKKLAQNVYLNIKVDSQNIMEEFTEWNLQDNVYLFDCNNIEDPSMINRISSLWELEKWNDKLNEFYDDLKAFFSFEGLTDEEIYKRYSYGYSTFFVYFYEKHPLLPKSFITKDYALGKVLNLLEETLKNYTDTITNHYKLINS